MQKMSDFETMLTFAMKLLAKRDYSTAELRQKLVTKYGEAPDGVIEHLILKRFLDDRRFAEAYISGKRKRGMLRLKNELEGRGVPSDVVAETLAGGQWPSLHEALTARMVGWKLRAPLHRRDAARLFRALARLGYEEDAIREEIDQLHEQ
jgi:regulatory protein